MLLSHKTSIKISQEYSNIIGHMCYAASKLWNICNYERHHYKELGLEKYPDWYYQKKAHKGNLWYKQLPSHTCRWGSGMRKAQTSCVCRCQRI